MEEPQPPQEEGPEEQPQLLPAEPQLKQAGAGAGAEQRRQLEEPQPPQDGAGAWWKNRGAGAWKKTGAGAEPQPPQLEEPQPPQEFPEETKPWLEPEPWLEPQPPQPEEPQPPQEGAGAGAQPPQELEPQPPQLGVKGTGTGMGTGTGSCRVMVRLPWLPPPHPLGMQPACKTDNKKGGVRHMCGSL